MCALDAALLHRHHLQEPLIFAIWEINSDDLIIVKTSINLIAPINASPCIAWPDRRPASWSHRTHSLLIDFRLERKRGECSAGKKFIWKVGSLKQKYSILYGS